MDIFKKPLLPKSRDLTCWTHYLNAPQCTWSMHASLDAFAIGSMYHAESKVRTVHLLFLETNTRSSGHDVPGLPGHASALHVLPHSCL